MVQKHAIQKILFDKGFRGDFTLQTFFREGTRDDFLRFDKFFEVRLPVREGGGDWPKCHAPVRGGGVQKWQKKRQLII